MIRVRSKANTKARVRDIAEERDGARPRVRYRATSTRGNGLVRR